MTTEPADRPPDRVGLRGTPTGVVVLTVAVAFTGLLAAVLGLVVPPHLPVDHPLPGPARFGIATVAFAVAQLARLRFRTASGMVSITWGEAALVVCLWLVPAGWLPAAALLGVGTAWTVMSVVSDRRPALELAGIAGSLTAATALAAAVA
ncbi:GGDEF-domain containing protein, partial [Micromonospora chalcea]